MKWFRILFFCESPLWVRPQWHIWLINYLHVAYLGRLLNVESPLRCNHVSFFCLWNAGSSTCITSYFTLTIIGSMATSASLPWQRPGFSYRLTLLFLCVHCEKVRVSVCPYRPDSSTYCWLFGLLLYKGIFISDFIDAILRVAFRLLVWTCQRCLMQWHEALLEWRRLFQYLIIHSVSLPLSFDCCNCHCFLTMFLFCLEKFIT